MTPAAAPPAVARRSGRLIRVLVALTCAVACITAVTAVPPAAALPPGTSAAGPAAAAPAARSSVSARLRVLALDTGAYYAQHVQDRAPFGTAIPGEAMTLQGYATPTTTARTVVVQQRVGSAWREAARTQVRVDTTFWSLRVSAGAPGRYDYRAVVLATPTAAAAVSPTRSVTVVAPSISASAVPAARAGALVTVSGRAYPGRPGSAVEVWRLSGDRWVPVARVPQSADGSYAVRLLAPAAGRHTYRAVTGEPLATRFAIRSRTRAVTTTPASTSAAASTYLADVTPYALRRPREYPTGAPAATPAYRVGTVVLGGRAWPRSVTTASKLVVYDLEGQVASLRTTLTVLPADQRSAAHGRLVDVRVDGRLRLRRYLAPGDLLPLSLDLRGADELTITTADRSVSDTQYDGRDLVLVMPVLSTRSVPERGVDTSLPLSELTATLTQPPVDVDVIAGNDYTALYGGSLLVSEAVRAGAVGRRVSGAVEYDLGGGYRRLDGVALRADGGGEVIAAVRIYGDGALLGSLATAEASSSRSRPVPRLAVDVTGVRRLRIELEVDSGPTSVDYDRTLQVALVDPRLS